MIVKMKRTILYLIACVAFAMLVSACQKPDSEFVHDDPTITAASISPVKSIIATTVNGTINQETGEILFPIPKKVAEYYDLHNLRVRVNVGYDVKLSPSLSGVKDLSEEYEVTATATMTGNTKKYTLRAYFSRDIN